MEAAEDLYQDLMARLISSGSIKQADNPKSYLFKAAANLVKDHYRKKAAEQRMLDHVQNTPGVGEDPLTAERVVSAQQKFKLVEEALDELPARCREIFRMVRIDGKRQQAVADELGISLRTVENNLRKALIHCQSRVEDKELEE